MRSGAGCPPMAVHAEPFTIVPTPPPRLSCIWVTRSQTQSQEDILCQAAGAHVPAGSRNVTPDYSDGGRACN